MLVLPDEIRRLMGKEKFSYDDLGMSDSTVVVLDGKVLKIQKTGEESEHEYLIMEWLQDKLPVPKVLGYAKDEQKTYLLMTRVPGEISCEDKYMRNPEQLTGILATGLHTLWKVDISDCPYTCNLEKKLQLAKYSVENNRVDIDKAEPDTFGRNGFTNPAHLLEWLQNNMPEEELVLSHGDFCLPNLFLSEGQVSGYIDLGRTGRGDRWQDIALCYRSLIHNFGGKYTGKKYKEFNEDLLFEKLGIDPDWEKIRYYILLDELL